MTTRNAIFLRVAARDKKSTIKVFFLFICVKQAVLKATSRLDPPVDVYPAEIVQVHYREPTNAGTSYEEPNGVFCHTVGRFSRRFFLLLVMYIPGCGCAIHHHQAM